MINNKIAKIFPPGLVGLGYVIGVAGIITILQQSPISILLIALAIFMTTSTKGILLDPDKKRFKEYQQIFGVKFGSWESMDEFPDIVILKKNLSSKVTTYFTASEGIISESTVFDICLANKSHHKKIEAARIKNLEKAKELANEYAAKLNKEVKPYNPVISARSRARR